MGGEDSRILNLEIHSACGAVMDAVTSSTCYGIPGKDGGSWAGDAGNNRITTRPRFAAAAAAGIQQACDCQ